MAHAGHQGPAAPVVARELGYSVERLRQCKSQLFGTAADGEGESWQSQVRIRLGQWNEGKLKD